MRAISAGHAFWVIETRAGTLLCDPVFFDPFEQGTVTACPSRLIETENVPSFDALYLSHRHMDHFDIPTLKRLVKNKTVLVPDDRLSIASLKRLGFEKIHPMKPFEAFQLKREGATLTLIPTPSVSEDFLEYGLLMIEEDEHAKRVLFNQVDTPLSDSCIEKIQSLVSHIDVHLAMFASQDFGWFSSHTADLAQNYTQNLYAAHRLGAKVVVPAAAGFRFVDRYQHLNQLLFPISEERFKRDIHSLGSNIQCLSIMPGDVIEIAEEVVVHKQQAGFVHLREDDRHLLYHDPTTAIPSIRDSNTAQYPLEHLYKFVEYVVAQGFYAYINGAIAQQREEIIPYCTHKANYQVKVIFPDGAKLYSFIFSERGCVLERDAVQSAPDALFHLTATALLEWCEGKKSCWAIRPDSRKWNRLIVPKLTPMGLRSFEVELSDLLTHFVLNMRMRIKGEEVALLEYYGLA